MFSWVEMPLGRCATTAGFLGRYGPDMARIDHVLIPVDDLERAAADLQQEAGLGSVAGGRHRGHGTANRIVPLGASYLELIAVVDVSEAARSPFGNWVARRAAAGRPAGLCIAEAMDTVTARLGLSAVPMTRRLPDGIELAWRVAGMAEALSEGLPFFIEWDDLERHPGRSAVDHGVDPVGVEVTISGDVERLRDWVGDVPDVAFIPGPPGLAAVTISTDGGRIDLR